MLHLIAPEVFREIREFGDLTKNKLAGELGRKRQVVYRWEQKGQFPSRKQERILVEKAKLTRHAFVVIMCRVLSRFLGQRVIIAPGDRYVPSTPLWRASDLYHRIAHKLDRETREEVLAKLHQGRTLEAVAEQSCSMYERDIVRLIETALAARGESLPDVEPPDSHLDGPEIPGYDG